MSAVLKICPACGNELHISELSCAKCGIKIQGNFVAEQTSELNPKEWEFVKMFLRTEGNLSKMQLLRNESYSGIKNTLMLINQKLEGNSMNNNVIENFSSGKEDSKVVRRLKEKIVECGGKSYMPVLKGEPVPFWLSSSQNGFESQGLRGVVLEWKVFDAIVKKARSLGGMMYRGDAAAQSGARVGSKELPPTTIDAFISTEFFGAKVGDTVLRRSTYFSGILAWAGIVTNHKSQGNGGFITVNAEYMTED